MTAEITQADLDIAASFAGSFMFGPGKEKVLAEWRTLMATDEGYAPPLAYLFALHRTQARDTALEDVKAGISNAIRQVALSDLSEAYKAHAVSALEGVLDGLKTTPTESE